MWGSGVGWLAAVAGVACLAAAVAATGFVRARRRYARAIEERGWLLERERESAARKAVDAERARIARELHDIVSHNVSVMVIQAGAARQVLATDDPGVTAALLAVETAGRDTMTELRHLLGVLAPPAGGEDGGDLSPQPSLSQLSPLIDRIAFAGLPVEVRISGEPRPLPAGVDLTAYRIIQEALTNALRHGDGNGAEVSVRYADRYLRIEVLNSGPSVLTGGRTRRPGPDGRTRPGPEGRTRPEPEGRTSPGPEGRTGPGPEGEGRGLLGLRQRVAVFGGELDARRRLGGGFRVRARIPLEKP